MKKTIANLASVLAVVMGIAGIALVLYAWDLPPFRSAVQVTDNAYVRGSVTLISPQLSGYIVEVPVRDYEAVKAGQLLARLDDRIFRQKVDQAKAMLASQEAALANSIQQQRSAEAKIGASEAAVDSANFALRRATENWTRVEALAKKGVMGGVPVSRLEPSSSELRDLIIVASTEINTDEDRAAYVKALQEVL